MAMTMAGNMSTTPTVYRACGRRGARACGTGGGALRCSRGSHGSSQASPSRTLLPTNRRQHSPKAAPETAPRLLACSPAPTSADPLSFAHRSSATPARCWPPALQQGLAEQGAEEHRAASATAAAAHTNIPASAQRQAEHHAAQHALTPDAPTKSARRATEQLAGSLVEVMRLPSDAVALATAAARRAAPPGCAGTCAMDGAPPAICCEPLPLLSRRARLWRRSGGRWRAHSARCCGLGSGRPARCGDLTVQKEKAAPDRRPRRAVAHSLELGAAPADRLSSFRSGTQASTQYQERESAPRPHTLAFGEHVWLQPLERPPLPSRSCCDPDVEHGCTPGRSARRRTCQVPPSAAATATGPQPSQQHASAQTFAFHTLRCSCDTPRVASCRRRRSCRRRCRRRRAAAPAQRHSDSARVAQDARQHRRCAAGGREL